MAFLLRIAKLVALTGLIVLAARACEGLCGRRSGYRWRKAVWLIVALWLLTPFLGGALPTVQLTVRLPEAVGKNLPVSASAPATDATEEATAWDAPTEGMAWTAELPLSADIPQGFAPPTAAVGETAPLDPLARPFRMVTLGQALAALWIAGAAALAVYRLCRYRSIRKRLFAGSRPCGDEGVRECLRRVSGELGVKRELPLRVFERDGISPMILGYAETTLFLPPGVREPDMLEPVLFHELTHYRSRDLWYKLLISAVCDLYWFHPLLWLMRRAAFRDVEYVCDEKATRNMDLNARKGYGGAILKEMGRRRTMAFTTQFSQSGKQVKRRLENIFAHHSRGTGIALLLAAVLALGLGSAVTVSRGEMVEEPLRLRVEAGVIQDERTLDELRALYPDADILVETDEGEDAAGGFGYPTVSLVGNEEALALAEQGLAADLTDALAARGWEMNDAMRLTVSDGSGRVYGIPCPPSYAFGLVANAELFERAGLTDEAGVPRLPATWEELARTAARIKEATGQAGLCLITDDVLGAMQFWNVARCFGAEPFLSVSPDGSLQARLDSAGAVEAMTFIQSLRWDYDVLTDDPTKENFLTAYERLGRGEAAMVIGASDALSFPVSAGLDAGSVALGALPAGPAGERHSFYVGSVLMLSADAAPEEIDAALTLAELLGYGPALNDASEVRLREAIESQRALGGPVIGQIPVWRSEALADFERELLDSADAADPAMVQGFLDAVMTPGNLTGESVPYRSELCLTLCDVLHRVVTDADADVPALMKDANDRWQAVLDS